MIYAFSKSLAAALTARHFPYKVTYTPFLDVRVTYGAGIVVARTRGQNEKIGAVVGPRRNPRSVLTRYLSADLWIFAQSSRVGARAQEHEDECDKIVDGALTAANDLVRGAGSPDFLVPEARYLTAEERAAAGGFVEQWPGAVYYARVIVPRGVSRLTYAGAGAPTGEVGEVDTEVTAGTDPAATAETVGEIVALPAATA